MAQPDKEHYAAAHHYSCVPRIVKLDMRACLVTLPPCLLVSLSPGHRLFKVPLGLLCEERHFGDQLVVKALLSYGFLLPLAQVLP